MKSLWLDITSTTKWNRPAVGILRVEKEVARYFLELNTNLLVRYCIYDQSAIKLFEIPRELVKNSVNDYTFGGVVLEKLEKRALHEVNFKKNDIYLTIGLDWDHKNYTYLYEVKVRSEIKVITMCYDLIPVLFPHLVVANVAGVFAKYFADLAWLSDHVFCISKNTENDLINFLNEIGAPLPTTSVIRLGENIVPKDCLTNKSSLLKATNEPYILFVSTIERRKNHEVIYRAIVKIINSQMSPPHVVFVGMNGWGVADFLNDIRLDPRVQNKVTILNNVDDDNLAALYKNALFTVYPSLYEGWGLPVAESLSYGKFCIASNSSSIPEIGGEFIDYVDPYDVSGWAQKILYYTRNQQDLDQRVNEITKNYKPYAWRETGYAIESVLLNIG